MKTISVSPLDLKVGDKVLHHGCVMQVEIIIAGTGHNVGAVACISRVIGDGFGSIPKTWFQTPSSMLARGGRDYAKDLPDGLYWNVQGNNNARVSKIASE